MHFDNPTLCENARVGQCFSKCRYIIFRKGRSGPAIPYNADGSGGHKCNPPTHLRRDEFALQVFSYALNGFPIASRCHACYKSIFIIPLARDTVEWSLPTKLRFNQLEWPWELHQSAECELPLWDGHVSYFKRECVKENLTPKLALVVSMRRVKTPENHWKAAVQTACGEKSCGLFDKQLDFYGLHAMYRREGALALLKGSGDVVRMTKPTDESGLDLPPGWLQEKP